MIPYVKNNYNVQWGDSTACSLYPRILHPAKHASQSACIFLVIAVAADRSGLWKKLTSIDQIDINFDLQLKRDISLRYHAICNPMKARPSARSVSVIVFFVSVTINLPRLLEYQVICP